MKISILKKVGCAAIVGTVMYVFGPLPACAEDIKIGYVDAQEVLDNSLKGKEVKDRLNEYVQSRQKIVDIEEADLKKLQDDFSKQGAILSPEARREKEELLQKRFMEYQKKVTELQKEIQQKRTEILEEFNVELEDIVQTIGEKEGYAIIFNNLDINIVMFAKPSLNLTDRIIAEMDKKMKKEKTEK